MKAQFRRVIRRQRDILFPDRATRQYRVWIADRQRRRSNLQASALEPGLLSIITAVWDGSPVSYLEELAASIAPQICGKAAQWFILANGCENPALLHCLQHLGALPFVTISYSRQNGGIVRGLRACLEGASGCYILPVDADDRLYPDALRIVTGFIQHHQYPPLLYTDEDKVSGAGVYQPYFKPDWDPVLLANSAYIAHLGVADRQLALDLGAYSDISTEGSADWDLFMRFSNAGHRALHIPEVLYSWRIHSQSTADDAAAKPYIRDSQTAVLRRFLAAHPTKAPLDITPSPLFGADAAHLCWTDPHSASNSVPTLSTDTSLEELLQRARYVSERDNLLALLSPGLVPRESNWQARFLSLFELFPDTVMVGGRVTNPQGQVIEGPRSFGFGGLCDCPDKGRTAADPGYFGQLWKVRSVSALSSRLCLVRASMLVDLLPQLPACVTTETLGCWIGAEALRRKQRIVYSPYVHAIEKLPATPMPLSEQQQFRHHYADLIPDRRYYPEPFSLTHAYRLAATS